MKKEFKAEIVKVKHLDDNPKDRVLSISEELSQLDNHNDVKQSYTLLKTQQQSESQ